MNSPARTSLRPFVIATALLLALTAILLMASAAASDTAFAQQGAGTQYPDGDVGPGGGGGGDSDLLPDGGECENPPCDGGPGDGSGPSAGSGAGDDGGGNLPFTGYPLSTLILILALLLIAGLAVRSYIAVRDRFRARSAGSLE